MSNAAQEIFQMVYASSATVSFSKEELRDLLKRSRQKNAGAGISGLLLYHDGNFMQLLEGDETQVRATYDRIQQDPRHHGCLLMIKRRVAERLFPDWSMGFRDFESAEVQAMPGYSRFLQREDGENGFPLKPGGALTLLRSFRDSLR